MDRSCFILMWMCVAAVACDPAAKASGQSGQLTEQRSRLGESCAASVHCASGLRCLERTCQEAASSRMGEFFGAAGTTAMQAGDLEQAIEAFAQAVNHYAADKIDAPAELYCAQGAALVQDRRDATRAELAARVLHRCLLGAPPKTALHRRAMRDLALLVEVGLDPLLLARNEPADRYLTRAPLAPPVAAIKVTATAQGRAPGSRTFTNWVEQLGSEAVKQALTPCWQANFDVTRERAFSVVLGFKYTYKLDQHDDFDRSVLTINEPPAGADQAVASCVREALAPIADAYSKDGAEANWRADLRILVGE
jgi:hypothetical protein